MKCSYCYLENKNNNVMSWDIARKAVDLLDGNDREKSLSFFGGEPLLQSNLLFEIAGYIRKKMGPEVNLNITTNGILLTPDVMEKLQKYNIFVVLSMDGYGEEANKHRKLCDGRNYWSILEFNLKRISVKDIGAVRMTVTPDSVSKLYYNCSCLLSQGFEHINFALDYSSVWSNRDLEIYKSQFIKILQLYYKQIVQNDKVCIDFVDYIILNALGKEKIVCNYGFGSFAVSASGYVFPCHREVLDTAWNEGTSLDEFILNGLNKKHRCSEVQDVMCRKCDLYSRCSICMVNLKKMGGSLKYIPELICSINKIHILETDKMLKKLYDNHRKQFRDKYQPLKIADGINKGDYYEKTSKKI